MDQSLYRKLCVANIMNGVTEGLSKFSHPSRVALVFAPDPDDLMMVMDPQDLLRGHAVKVHTMFGSEEERWRCRRTVRYPLFITASKSVNSAAGDQSAGIHRNRWFWIIS